MVNTPKLDAAWDKLKTYEIDSGLKYRIFKFPKAEAKKAFKLWKQYLENEPGCDSNFNEEDFIKNKSKNIYIALITEYDDMSNITYIMSLTSLIEYHKKQITKHKKQCDNLEAILSV